MSLGVFKEPLFSFNDPSCQSIFRFSAAVQPGSSLAGHVKSNGEIRGKFIHAHIWPQSWCTIANSFLEREADAVFSKAQQLEMMWHFQNFNLHNKKKRHPVSPFQRCSFFEKIGFYAHFSWLKNEHEEWAAKKNLDYSAPWVINFLQIVERSITQRFHLLNQKMRILLAGMSVMPEISIKIYFKRGGFSKGLALLHSGLSKFSLSTP